MNINPSAVNRPGSTASNITPEKGPFRESPGSGPVENGRIVEVAFKPTIARFRESPSKPPRKRPNAERRSREFLPSAEVEKLVKAARTSGDTVTVTEP